MDVKPDYYELLGVSREASPDEIKRAYRRLARLHHPDVSADENAHRLFQDINEAYETLSDARKRELYDRFGHEGLRDQASFGGEDIFGGLSDILNSFFGGIRTEMPRQSFRGEDLQLRTELTLEEVLHGTQKTLKFKRMELCRECFGSGSASGAMPGTCSQCGGMGQVRRSQNTFFATFQTVTTCPKCSGSGRSVSDPCRRCGGEGREVREVERTIALPAGLEDGVSIRISQEGNAGKFGAERGDLYVVVRESAHELFERQGCDILCELEIGIATAALGGRVIIPALDGDVEVNIRPGTQSGTEVLVKGHGLPGGCGRGRGDLRVFVTVVIPTKLSSRQRGLLEQFSAEEERENVTRNDARLLGRLRSRKQQSGPRWKPQRRS
jgi:molecular chaperone DnaJ